MRVCRLPRLHHHHRGLQRLLQCRQGTPGRPLGRHPRGRQGRREAVGQGLRRSEEPAPRLGPLRRQVLDAGHDGHRPQPRPQRDHPPGPHRHQRQRALRLGRLPPLHLDVRPDRPGRPDARGQGQGRLHRRVQPLRRGPRSRQGEARQGRQGHRPQRRRPQEARRRRTRRSSRTPSAATSRTIRTSSSTWPSRRSSLPGSASAPTTTATARRSPTTSAPRSTS